MVSFTHNGSEIATWMGHNFKNKNKSTKHERIADHYISTKTLELNANSLNQ